jgi:hypothetical protein
VRERQREEEEIGGRGWVVCERERREERKEKGKERGREM